MAETTEKTGEKKLSVAPTKTLSLKGRGVEQGVVRQSFSHGRTKAVVVEKVKSRVPTRAKADSARAGGAGQASGDRQGLPRAARGDPGTGTGTQAVGRPGPAQPDRGGAEGARHALNDARLREAEERKIAEEEAFVRKSREAAERTEREAAEARKADEEKRRKHDLETKVKAEQEAKKRFGEDTTAAADGPPARRGRRSSPTRRRLRAPVAVPAALRVRRPRRSRRAPAPRRAADGSRW